jgi:hypothetical protein
MQTFLPYQNFRESAKALDWRRLGKQRVEAKQILLALADATYGWQNHPAVKMWRGHEWLLSVYGCEICEEWRRRGYKDAQLDWFNSREKLHSPSNIPAWLSNEQLFLSHRSNLVRKLPEHYGPLWPDVPNNLPYVWPV